MHMELERLLHDLFIAPNGQGDAHTATPTATPRDASISIPAAC